MRRFAAVLALTALLPVTAWSARAVESAPVRIKDDRGARVTLEVPLAIHRGANHFRLYGPRPMTLHSRDRRRDLYREALLDHATRASLAPRTTAWDDIAKQVEWLRSTSGVPAPPAIPLGDFNRVIDAWVKKARSVPGFGHVEALSRAFGKLTPQVDLPESLMSTLQLRALATDEAERRLLVLGKALRLDEPGTDPALSEAYGSAVVEFQTVRRDLWTALSNALQKNQGRLLLSAVREVVLSPLGAWAVFGYLGWRGVETVFTVEHRGQMAICSAGLARRLQGASTQSAELAPLAAYAEFALAYQLTEALKQEGLMALKPAGRRSAGDWQIELSGRIDELKKAL